MKDIEEQILDSIQSLQMRLSAYKELKSFGRVGKRAQFKNKYPTVVYEVDVDEKNN